MLKKTPASKLAEINLHFPDIVMIPADQMYVDPTDIAVGLQRDPCDRLHELVDAFGENGERFNPEIFGVILVKEDGEGTYAISDGGGRHFGVTHLLDDPSMALPCIVAKGTKRTLFRGQNKRVAIAAGNLFWEDCNNKNRKYEYEIGKILRNTRGGFTTVNGKEGSVKPNNVCFAHDLGVLREALTLADLHWSGPKRNKRIEGIGLTGLAAFLALHPDHDGARLDHILTETPYFTLKEGAKQFLPANKEHQRQWGVAIYKAIVNAYNLGVRKIKPLDGSRAPEIQHRLQDSERFQRHSQVWQMLKVVTE